MEDATCDASCAEEALERGRDLIRLQKPPKSERGADSSWNHYLQRGTYENGSGRRS